MIRVQSASGFHPMTDSRPLGFGTRAIHAGQSPDPSTGAVMTPIYATSTYVQQSPGVHQGYEYSRSHNPTRFAYERCVASLESGAHGYAFASGLAATGTVLETLDAGSFTHGEGAVFVRVEKELRFSKSGVHRAGLVCPLKAAVFAIEAVAEIEISAHAAQVAFAQQRLDEGTSLAFELPFKPPDRDGISIPKFPNALLPAHAHDEF